MKTQQEIWESIAKPVFPALTGHQLSELKRQAAMDWGFGIDNKQSRVYDQYVMMKNLMGAKFE